MEQKLAPESQRRRALFRGKLTNLNAFTSQQLVGFPALQSCHERECHESQAESSNAPTSQLEFVFAKVLSMNVHFVMRGVVFPEETAVSHNA